jgi:membrane protease YdiL (CAAX protease family)
LCYLVFVGSGEEILYRGYIQTRLSEAFGRPFRFGEVAWRWGVIVTSLLFGLSHLLNGWDSLTGRLEPQWWWAAWTFFAGLVFSYVRERTGSIVAPALLRWLPQALVYLVIRAW